MYSKLNHRLGISATEAEWKTFDNAVKKLLDEDESALDFSMPPRVRKIADMASKRLVADFDGASSRDLMHLYSCMVMAKKSEALSVNSCIAKAVQDLVYSNRFFPNETKTTASRSLPDRPYEIPMRLILEQSSAHWVVMV